MELKILKIEKPDDINFILGQNHFIKTVEDIHESLISTFPGIGFGLGFCESSGDCLVCFTGNDDQMIKLAIKHASALLAGHAFILFLKPGFFPVNVLNVIKTVPEVCNIFFCHGKSCGGHCGRNPAGSGNSGGHRWPIHKRGRTTERH